MSVFFGSMIKLQKKIKKSSWVLYRRCVRQKKSETEQKNRINFSNSIKGRTISLQRAFIINALEKKIAHL